MNKNIHALPNKVDPLESLHMELGVSTTQGVASSIYEDFLPELRGSKAVKVWKEMASNDATVASILYAINMLAREVDWRVEPFNESTQAEAAADFLNNQLGNLAHPFADTVSEAMSALQFGFAFHEIVYRIDAGQVGWERFSFRPQETLLRWIVDEKLRPVGFQQQTFRDTSPIIPVDTKGLLFRTDTTTPSGKPILRGAYRSWMFKKRAEEQLMIGMSRHLAGMPKALVPSEILAAGPGNDMYDTLYKTVTRVKKDEQMGIMFPSDRDDNGNLLYEFDLVAPNSTPNFAEQVGVIRMFAGDIAATVLAQFVGLGRDAIGSRALAEPQQELFQTALEGVLDMFEDTINRQLVQPLFRLNPQYTMIPRMVHGKVRDVDLAGVTEGILKTSQAGFDWTVDETIMAQLRDMLGFDATTQIE